MDCALKTRFRSVLEIKTVQLTPSASFSQEDCNDSEHRRLNRSLRSFGMIMPLVVYPLPERKFKVLDGNKRLRLLVPQAKTIECVVATDGELRHNRRSGYLSAIAKHELILRALAKHRIDHVARALGVQVECVERSRDLLNGLSDDALGALQDKNVTLATIEILGKMNPSRQMEVAELMIAMNNFSGKIARCLLAGSAEKILVQRLGPGRAHRGEQGEADAEAVLKNSSSIRRSYGTDILDLTVLGRYIERLLGNGRISDLILTKHPKMFHEFQSLVEVLQKERSDISVAKRRFTVAATRIGSRDRKKRVADRVETTGR